MALEGIFEYTGVFFWTVRMTAGHYWQLIGRRKEISITCNAETVQYIKTLSLLGVKVFSMERTYKYGLEEGKEEPCGDALELEVS